MQFPRGILIPAFALTVTLVNPGRSVAAPTFLQPAPYAQDRDRDRDWDAPPREFNEVQRRGFHDGIEGARRDYGVVLTGSLDDLTLAVDEAATTRLRSELRAA